jgi:uncharacterized RDD family membrane protein YckC
MAPVGLIPVLAPTTADGVALASFGRRFFATILDTVLVSSVASAVLPFFINDFQARVLNAMQELYAIVRSGQGEVSADVAHLQTILLYVVMAATFAYSLLTLVLWSRTLGQRVTGIAVCPADKGKEKIGWRQAISRTLLWTALSQGPGFLVLIQMVSVSLVLWHPRRQTLPDLIARTQVVRR